MFDDFGSITSLWAIGDEFVKSAIVGDYLLGMIGFAIALAVMGLVIRARTGGGDGDGGSLISGGSPMGLSRSMMRSMQSARVQLRSEMRGGHNNRLADLAAGSVRSARYEYADREMRENATYHHNRRRAMRWYGDGS